MYRITNKLVLTRLLKARHTLVPQQSGPIENVLYYIYYLPSQGFPTIHEATKLNAETIN